jgi:hypothetical protein
MGGANSATHVNGSGGRVTANDGAPGDIIGTVTEHMFLNGIGLFSGRWQGSVELAPTAGFAGGIPGRYALPTGVTWSIAAGAEKITFSGLPINTDPTDYFYPYQLIELVIKNESNKPVRRDWLITTHVDSTGVYFLGYESNNYFNTVHTGMANTTLYRHFGTSVIAGGHRTTVTSVRANASATLPNMPMLAMAPNRGILNVSGWCGASSGMAVDVTQQPVVCAHNGGISQYTDDWVIWDGNGYRPNHPQIITSTPQNLENRKPVKKTRREVMRDRYDYFIEPGRGLSGGGGHGLRDLTYYFMEDPENGDLVMPMYRLIDKSEAYIALYEAGVIYKDFPPPQPAIFDVRVWSDGVVALGVRVYDGATFTNVNTVDGWQTIRIIPTGTPTAWRLYTTGEVYLAYCGIKIAPFDSFPLNTTRAGVATIADYPHDGMWGFHTNTDDDPDTVTMTRNVLGVVRTVAAFA